MKRTASTFAFLAACLFLGASVLNAATVHIDLSGAVTGTSIVAPGGSFAQTFEGQTVVNGVGIDGFPTDPLTLKPAGTLFVEFFDPGVSPAGNSILSESGKGPLSVFFERNASRLVWSMGFLGESPGDHFVHLYMADSNGDLIQKIIVPGRPGFNVYSVEAPREFRGVTFYNYSEPMGLNSDPVGLRFMNFSYDEANVVPEPATLVLMLAGLVSVVLLVRR